MQIKYFSWVKDQIGEESENIKITEQIITVKDLINYLKKNILYIDYENIDEIEYYKFINTDNIICYYKYNKYKC